MIPQITPRLIDYYYKKVGFDILDQTQREKAEKSNSTQLHPVDVFSTIWEKIHKVNKVTQKYGVTLTFKRKFHDIDPLELHRMVIKKMGNSRMCKKINYILIPEFTSKGQLHYHGIVWDSYQLPFIKFSKWWKRTYGFSKEELDIRYYFCGSIDYKKCLQKEVSKAKHCWSHYITKSVGKTGLWTLTNGV